MKKLVIMAIAAGLLSSSAFGAAYSTDFESGLDAGWTGGTIVTDQAVSGTSSLFLGAGEMAQYQFSDGIPWGDLTLWVYDRGAMEVFDGPNVSAYGPRWGLVAEQDGSSVAGGTIIWRSSLNGDAGYGNSWGQNPVTTGSWWSPYWQGGPRVQGWMKWTIKVRPDTITIEAEYPDGTAHTSNTQAGVTGFDPSVNQGAMGIYLFGGRTVDPTGDGTPPHDVWIDDVNWTPIPEPASLGLLAIGGLLAIRRR